MSLKDIKERLANISSASNVKSNIDFNKYHFRMPKEYQKIGILFLLKNSRVVLADDMGLGKATLLSTPILTPTGWVLMRDIKVDDDVINSQGLVSQVTGVYPQGIKKTYKITFTDNTFAECCDEHLWSVQTPCRKWNNYSPKVLSTNQLRTDPNLVYANKNVKYFIPIIKPIQFSNKQFIIPPYFLGLLLGDGCLTQTQIAFATDDEEIVNYIEFLKNTQLNVFPKKCKEQCYNINKHDPSKENIFLSELKRLNLHKHNSYNKFIPQEYLFGSIKQRTDLLCGLMDSDGYACLKTGVSQFTSTSEDLIKDITFLIQSLGGIVKRREKYPVFTYKGVKKAGAKAYELTLSLPPDIIPFKLTRKIAAFRSKSKYLPYRGIKSIEYIGEKETQCISVNSSDKLYVINDCILTHNTIQAAIGAIETNENFLIVCPNSLKLKWRSELLLLNVPNTDISVIYANKKWEASKYTIINYDILGKFTNDILLENYYGIISDECHGLKNIKSLRFKNFEKISNSIKVLWLLTGTPITNKPIDLFTLLKLLNHKLGVNRGFFIARYCGGVRGPFGFTTDGASNLQELREKIKSVFLRRLKIEVLTELPPKSRTVIPIDLKNQREYKKIVEHYFNGKYHASIDVTSENFNENPESAMALVEMSVIRKFLALEKIKDGTTFELIDNSLEKVNKIVIFTNYSEVVDLLVEQYKFKILVIDGRIKQNKQDIAQEFQTNPEKQIIVCNYVAGSVGLDLFAAEIEIMNDLPWNPDTLLQAEDRIYRIGTINAVNILYPTYVNTYDEIMLQVINEKLAIIEQIIDGKLDNVTNISVINEIVSRFK
jgi:hypothetical protein